LTDDPAPSAIARALARDMRAFDAMLTDAQIEEIARRIDRSRAAGAALSPKKKRFANAVEPLTAVRLPDEPA
jgi:hypothetical protein